MGRIGCTINGDLDDSKFSEPMPWIGIYVAAASVACAMSMVADAFNGFRHKKFWFPCKFLSLNAMTLTLVSVAIKFSVDLNASMPHRQDQLVKVSSSAFICTVMSNLMPSLGILENKELVMNILALGILVITDIVNICIQLGTGVIFVFWKEHAFIMLLMLVLLALLGSVALAVPTTKIYLELKYREKVEVAKKECFESSEKSVDQQLREGLKKYWMMAYTCTPQFVIGRSAACTASGAFCLLSALTLAEAMLRSYLMPWSLKFCNGRSDYKWSTSLVLVTQTIAVGIGTIAPVSRWYTAVNFRCAKKATKPCKFELLVEKYWIRKLLEWKEQPLSFRIWGRHGRKYVHNAKYRIMDLCIGLQKGIVLASKLIRLISIFVVSRFLKLEVLIKCNNSITNNDSDLESQPTARLNLSSFVIHLEGEEDLVDLMMENNSYAVDHWIGMGNKKQPKNLIQLLEKFNSGKQFRGVREFDSEQIPSLESEEPPNCWALPLVTLTSIAIALPNIDNYFIKQLVASVHEGLLYVREVENNLDKEQDLRNTRKAADIVWLGVDLYKKWLEVDLRKISLQRKNGKEVLQTLADVAKNKFMEFRKKEMIQTNGCLREDPSKWPVKVLAANSMYRICKTILLDYESKDADEYNQKLLFEKISIMTAGMLRACLTNLEHVIFRKLLHSRIEERIQSIRYAVLLYGRAEKIMKIVDRRTAECAEPDELTHIDDWHPLCEQKDSNHFNACLGDGDSFR